MRKKTLDAVARVGSVILALVLLPFLMLVGFAVYIARALSPSQRAKPRSGAFQKPCQALDSDGPF